MGREMVFMQQSGSERRATGNVAGGKPRFRRNLGGGPVLGAEMEVQRSRKTVQRAGVSSFLGPHVLFPAPPRVAMVTPGPARPPQCQMSLEASG